MMKKKKKDNRAFNAKSSPYKNAILNEPAQDITRKTEIEKTLRNFSKSRESEKSRPITKPDLNSVKVSEHVEDILTALREMDSNEIVSFDVALEKLKKIEVLQEDETIAYIGAGCFGVVAYVSTSNNKREKKVMEIRRKIEFEDPYNHLEWRAKLCYDLSLTHTLDPAPLSELYTEQELLAFPQFS